MANDQLEELIQATKDLERTNIYAKAAMPVIADLDQALYHMDQNNCEPSNVYALVITDCDSLTKYFEDVL